MKAKIIKNTFIVFTAIAMMLYPLSFTANIAYALPSLPGTPSTPSLPNTPDNPDIPNLPGEEETNNPGRGSNHNPSGGSDAGTGSSNSDTGADSNNTSDTTIDNDVDTSINNNADIDNLADVDATSGNNDANKNTGNGDISTGDATISGSVETSANSVSLSVLECSTECDVIDIASLESRNSNTGTGSDNSSNTSLTSDSDLDIDNDADLDNFVMFDANSGDNSASLNTGNGTIDTGDAEIVLTAINVANNINVGYEVFNIFDDQTGDIIIDFDDISGTAYGGIGANSSNNTTGADSNNTASTDTNNSNTILIDNEGNVVNNYYLDANTGNNTADKNTGNGSVATGDANVVFNLLNFFNNVFLGGGGELLLGVVNIFGTLDGNIVLTGLDGPDGIPYNPYLSSSNSTTGAGSDNDASTSLSNGTDLTLTNSAGVLNNVTLDANTGDNNADKNTGSGQINSGNTNVNLNVTNVTNNTGIGNGGTIWMVLVNNLGSWTGQLFDTNGSTGAYSPFFTFTIGADGSLTSSNQNTGADSTNDASTSVDNDTDIAVTNNAVVTNNVMIDANTGNNSASKNTGSGTITTGDASIAANIVNMLNNVFLGGRFALTIVNIFGSFLGDIHQGNNDMGTLTVDPSESIAISPTQTARSSNPGIVNAAGSNFAIGSAQTNLTDDQDDPALVLASNIGNGNSEPLQVARFSTDPGLFDDFKLEYLLFPVIFGTAFTLIRRALVRR